MKIKNIWQINCPISFDKLKLVTIAYHDFTGNVKNGQMIVFKAVAENVITIFKELFHQRFPINKVNLIDDYDGDDNISMADNNSSCFNFRNIEGTNQLSMHAYGLAIDINPVQNPYIIIDENMGKASIYPKEGINFLNRHNVRQGMVEPVVHIFKKQGFTVWGGQWDSPIDYHHFQIERGRVDALIKI